MDKGILFIGFASYKAACYACRNWHYSRTMPTGKMVRFGVWERGIFKGVIIFSRGATPNIGSPFNLKQTEVCELTRVALTEHESSVSRMIGISIRIFRRHFPSIKLLVSFADTSQGHHGGIYQASGWIYIGRRCNRHYLVRRKKVHPKTLHSKYGYGAQSLQWMRKNLDKNACAIKTELHKYVYPLDEKVAENIIKLKKTYPKRPKQAMAESLGTAAG